MNNRYLLVSSCCKSKKDFFLICAQFLSPSCFYSCRKIRKRYKNGQNVLITSFAQNCECRRYFVETRWKYVLQGQRRYAFCPSLIPRRREPQRDFRFGRTTRPRRPPISSVSSVVPSSYIVVCLPRRMHRIITKLLTIPASGPPALSIRFASIARSEESKMAVSDRGRVSRQRSADEDEGEGKRKGRKKKEDRLSAE